MIFARSWNKLIFLRDLLSYLWRNTKADKRSRMISIENALTSLYESGDISQAFLNKSRTLTAWYLCVPFFQVMFDKKEPLI